jgi:polysaccharide export outer membrane protein
MVKATWAVACLLAVLLAAGCSNMQTVKADDPPIKETPIVEVSARPTSVSLPVATKKGVETAVSVAAPLEGSQYKLGPEDFIKVSVWENKDLTLDLVVRPDGKISMPLIQDVTAEGATAVELAALIQQKLTAYIKDPQVSVILLQVNAPKYYVIGNVTKPGTYPLRSETSVLEALALAGGFTQFASPRSIKLIRKNNGKQELRKINYNKLVDEGGEGNYLLRSGDTVVVP